MGLAPLRNRLHNVVVELGYGCIGPGYCILDCFVSMRGKQIRSDANLKRH